MFCTLGESGTRKEVKSKLLVCSFHAHQKRHQAPHLTNASVFDPDVIQSECLNVLFDGLNKILTGEFKQAFTITIT